jgi:hypothetical protein
MTTEDAMAKGTAIVRSGWRKALQCLVTCCFLWAAACTNPAGNIADINDANTTDVPDTVAVDIQDTAAHDARDIKDNDINDIGLSDASDIGSGDSDDSTAAEILDTETPEDISDAVNADTSDIPQDIPFEFPDAAVATEGQIRMLIYNVAGLPMELSDVNPIVHMPMIAPKLNDYEMVLVQEDFWYHADLEAGTTHLYKSDPMWAIPDWDNFGDGLNTFSNIPFEPVTRVGWEQCNGLLDQGSDCMTTKGFTWTRHQLARGVFIDVYNLHMDAGGSDEDKAARQAQAIQLAAFITTHSEGAAILLGGDTNMRRSRPGDDTTLDNFLGATGLTESCEILSCGVDGLDRIMVRSSATVILAPLEWSIPSGFVDDEGVALSDHEPVFNLISWHVLQ